MLKLPIPNIIIAIIEVVLVVTKVIQINPKPPTIIPNVYHFFREPALAWA